MKKNGMRVSGFRSGIGCITALAAGILLDMPHAHAQVSIFKSMEKSDSAMARWLSGITLTGQVEGGIMANPARPQPGYNFGDFFADHANQVQLNQAEFTLQKAIDPSQGGYQVGFTLEACTVRMHATTRFWVSARMNGTPATS